MKAWQCAVLVYLVVALVGLGVLLFFTHNDNNEAVIYAHVACDPPYTSRNGVHEVGKAIRSDMLGFHYIVTIDGRAWRMPFDKCAVIIQEVK